MTNLTDNEKENNPDFFYLSRAIEDIKNWFIAKKTIYPKIQRKIENIIINEDYNGTRVFPFYEDSSDEDKNELRRLVLICSSSPDSAVSEFLKASANDWHELTALLILFSHSYAI